MKKEEIQLLVKFAIQNSKHVDIYKIKKAAEIFIAGQPGHMDDWIISGKSAKDYVLPELPVLMEVLRELETNRVKGEIEDLKSWLETLEDKEEFENFMDFLDYSGEEEK